MGQPHQVFLIARILPHGAPPNAPPRHRCIGAYNHRWCYGRLPLRAVRRFLTLVRNEENAAVIRAELRAIDGKYGVFGSGPDVPYIPCPYAVSLLGAALNTDLDGDGDGRYVSGITFEEGLYPASMGCWDGRQSLSPSAHSKTHLIYHSPR